jgi:predicted nucleic acid-binding protein
LVLDTSAIIAMVERKNPRVREALRANGNTVLPFCHPVTLGELAAGVYAAQGVPGERIVVEREHTFAVARSLPAPHDPLGEVEVGCFGIVSVLTSRRLSHNDHWILASCAAEQAQLITEDARQARASTDPELRRALMDRLGVVLHPAVFVGSR